MLKNKKKRKGSQRKGGNLMNLYPRKVTDREMINSLSQTVSACWTPSKLGDIITLLCNVISIPRAKVGRSRGAKDHRRLGSKSSHPRLWHWHWRETPPPSLHSLKKKKKVWWIMVGVAHTRGKDTQHPTGSQDDIDGGRGVQHQCQVYKVDVALRRQSQNR